MKNEELRADIQQSIRIPNSVMSNEVRVRIKVQGEDELFDLLRQAVDQTLDVYTEADDVPDDVQVKPVYDGSVYELSFDDESKDDPKA